MCQSSSVGPLPMPQFRAPLGLTLHAGHVPAAAVDGGRDGSVSNGNGGIDKESMIRRKNPKIQTYLTTSSSSCTSENDSALDGRDRAVAGGAGDRTIRRTSSSSSGSQDSGIRVWLKQVATRKRKHQALIKRALTRSLADEFVLGSQLSTKLALTSVDALTPPTKPTPTLAPLPGISPTDSFRIPNLQVADKKYHHRLRDLSEPGLDRSSTNFEKRLQELEEMTEVRIAKTQTTAEALVAEAQRDAAAAEVRSRLVERRLLIAEEAVLEWRRAAEAAREEHGCPVEKLQHQIADAETRVVTAEACVCDAEDRVASALQDIAEAMENSQVYLQMREKLEQQYQVKLGSVDDSIEEVRRVIDDASKREEAAKAMLCQLRLKTSRPR
eukprot:TRINITY_DN55037_c0_g1_i1.p1 TRINITY_DN55037_c0_g1~~TRINITY_DN55037_c0_g1_i1.p1  ORF type:complete len:384 (-),score=95.79 TRINITY_DN55037_c0_g1_i1:589-1740(-)